MSELDWKRRLGWDDRLEAAMEPFSHKGLVPARVTLVYRKQLKVLMASGERWARTGGKLIHRAQSLTELPAVGDWVAAAAPEKEGEALVHALLPRRTAFIRKVPGTNSAPQVLAANVDVVMVMMGLDEDFNLRRLERLVSLAFESKALPMVVLNKLDVAQGVEEKLAQVRAVAGGAPVHAVSALTGAELEPVRAVFAAGKSVALLGSSGVGKSTLVNALAGTTVMTTGATRDDGKGRHTTTRRELFVLPGGGSVIDTPGLREVQLWAANEGLAKTFDDVEALAKQCRFADCSHDAEPGCAVKAAVEDGTLDEDRFASWQTLQLELDRLQSLGSSRGRPVSRRRERARKR